MAEGRKPRGPSPFVQARGLLETIVKKRGLEADEHVLLLRELIGAADTNERAERTHRANNALAGVLANLSYVALMLHDASPQEPLFVTSSPEDRANVLTAIGHALTAAKRLADLLRDDLE